MTTRLSNKFYAKVIAIIGPGRTILVKTTVRSAEGHKKFYHCESRNTKIAV